METLVMLAILVAIVWVIKIFLTSGGEELIRTTTQTASMNVSAWNAKAERHAADTIIDAFADFDQKKSDELQNAQIVRKELQDLIK